MLNIKNNVNTLRTKLSELLPKTLDFSKFLLIGILSGTIWLLHFIGVAADISVQFIKQLKSKMENKNG